MKQICHKCKEEKDVLEFYRSKVTKTGYRTSCKKCEKSADKRTPEANKERCRQAREKIKNLHKTAPTGESRICCDCGVEKVYANFLPSKYSKSGYRWECKDCSNKRSRRDYFKVAWGITLDELAEMKKKQNNQCAICKKTLKLMIDHNHKTGMIRELLCNNCNRGIGMLCDDENLIKRAFEYLIKHKEQPSGKKCLRSDRRFIAV